MEDHVTADLHIRHSNILKHSKRLDFMDDGERKVVESGDQQAIAKLRISRESTDRMNDNLVDQINVRVMSGDRLWILGDVLWAKEHEYARTLAYYLGKIKCKNIVLIWGNHDPDIKHQRSVREEVSRQLRGETYDKLTTRIQGQRVHLNHEAMAIWDGRHHGVWNLYGHSHAQAEKWLDEIMPGRWSMDVGVDYAKKILGEYRPFSFSEIKAIMAQRPGFGLLGSRNYHHKNETDEI